MKEETAVRTDYLLEDYDKIAAPGEAYNGTPSKHSFGLSRS